VLESAGSLSHGALVLEHTLALLRALGGTARPADAKNGVYAFGFGQGEIIVRAVDLGGPLASLAEVARRARQAVSSLSDVAVATVVNMSFAAVPCDIGDDFAANRAAYPTFRDYAAAVAGLPSNLSDLESTFGRSLDAADAAALTRAVLLRPVSGAELQDALGARQGEVRFVASSGNYGLPYALVPAAWPQVLGVAARDVARNPLDLASLSSFSDAAEVMVGGAYFTLRGLLDPLARVELPALVYAGTSFAAPATSVAVAFDLGQAVPRCGLDATGLPVLRGPDDDTPLETAVADRCAP